MVTEAGPEEEEDCKIYVWILYTIRMKEVYRYRQTTNTGNSHRILHVISVLTLFRYQKFYYW